MALQFRSGTPRCGDCCADVIVFRPGRFPFAPGCLAGLAVGERAASPASTVDTPMNVLRDLEKRLRDDPEFRAHLAEAVTPFRPGPPPGLDADLSKIISSLDRPMMPPDVPRCVVCGAVTRIFSK